MTQPALSPAAQAVWSALCKPLEQHAGHKAALAAAIRAVADQIVPIKPPPVDDGTREAAVNRDYWEDCQQHRAELLAIAAELEAKP